VTAQAVILCVAIAGVVAWRAIGAWERVHTAKRADPWKASELE
jgi:hypothetical protein